MSECLKLFQLFLFVPLAKLITQNNFTSPPVSRILFTPTEVKISIILLIF